MNSHYQLLSMYQLGLYYVLDSCDNIWLCTGTCQIFCSSILTVYEKWLILRVPLIKEYIIAVSATGLDTTGRSHQLHKNKGKEKV